MAGTNFDYSIRFVPFRRLTVCSGCNFLLRSGLPFPSNQ
jgi:hypothetical protein